MTTITNTQLQDQLRSAGLLTTGQAFNFDLLEATRSITSEKFAIRLLGRWAFACDAYISNVIHSKLRDYRAERELDGMAEWDSYQSFMAFMHEIASDEQAMADMGLDVKSIAEEVQKLYALRRAIHGVIAEKTSVGTYEEPSITEFFLNPKLRTDDANTLAKAEAVSKEFACDDDGVIDVEKMEMHARNLTAKRKLEKVRNLEFDRQRGKLSAVLFEFLLQQPTDVNVDEQYPFDVVDLPTRLKMISAMLERYVPGVLEQAVSDYAVNANELTMWQIEARPLRKMLKAAMGHPIFDDVKAAG